MTSTSTASIVQLLLLTLHIHDSILVLDLAPIRALMRHADAAHVQTQVRPAAQKQFVIVAAGIGTGRDAHKAVQVELSRKGVPCVCRHVIYL